MSAAPSSRPMNPNPRSSFQVFIVPVYIFDASEVLTLHRAAPWRLQHIRGSASWRLSATPQVGTHSELSFPGMTCPQIRRLQRAGVLRTRLAPRFGTALTFCPLGRLSFRTSFRHRSGQILAD